MSIYLHKYFGIFHMTCKYYITVFDLVFEAFHWRYYNSSSFSHSQNRNSLQLDCEKKNLKMHFYDSLLTKITVFENSFEGKWQIGFNCQGLFEIISLKIGLIKMTWKIREFYMSKWKIVTKNKCCHQNGLGITDQKKKKYHMSHGLESTSQYCQFHQQNKQKP